MHTDAGISDHLMPIQVKIIRRKKQENIYNYKKVDWDKINNKSSKFKETL